MGDTYYRYDGYTFVDHSVVCRELRVVKRTPKGAWLAEDWDQKGLHLKFILNSARRKFAYPTKEEALNSFRIRQVRRLQHLQNSIEKVTAYIELVAASQVQDRYAKLESGPPCLPFLP